MKIINNRLKKFIIYKKKSKFPLLQMFLDISPLSITKHNLNTFSSFSGNET